MDYQFLQQLQQLPFVEAIYLYGSRARGDHTETSDIDLAIVCPAADPKQWSKITDIVENADTLLEIDCVRYDKITDQQFLDQINRDKQVLYEQ